MVTEKECGLLLIHSAINNTLLYPYERLVLTSHISTTHLISSVIIQIRI